MHDFHLNDSTGMTIHSRANIVCLSLMHADVMSTDSKEMFHFPGVDFNTTRAIALAESLGIEYDSQFRSFEDVCRKWIARGINCTFDELIKALLMTRDLGKLVTGMCPPCKFEILRFTFPGHNVEIIYRQKQSSSCSQLVRKSS